MDAELSRSWINRETDPHDWNSYENDQTIHELRLTSHPLIDQSRPSTLEFREVEFEGVLFVVVEGRVFCQRNVILEVEKWFETRYAGGLLQIKGFLYRYVAWINNGNPILRYHNLHETEPDVYHHRVFNPTTGEQILHETLERVQLPVFTEVLDEIQTILRHLEP